MLAMLPLVNPTVARDGGCDVAPPLREREQGLQGVVLPAQGCIRNPVPGTDDALNDPRPQWLEGQGGLWRPNIYGPLPPAL